MLDVGCGRGNLVLALADLGAEATGLEISDELLAAARAADAGHRASWVVGRAEALPFPAASFDLVVFDKSLHHVPLEAMAPALAEAGRVLADDGRVFVAEPLLEGSFYEVVSLVEDETEVRTAAQAALGAAEEIGLQSLAVREYDVVQSPESFDALAAHIASVDPHRAPIIAQRDAQLREAFDRAGALDPGTGRRTFRQPMRAELLAVSRRGPAPSP